MFKKILIMSMVCVNAYADLTQTERRQLAWLSGFQYHSYEMDPYAKHQEKHIEIPRAITRMRCLELLRQGDRAAYGEFVSAQQTDCLSWASFAKLAAYLQHLDQAQYLLLRKAVILTAVSLTPQAQAQIPQVKIINNNALDFNAAWVRATAADRALYMIFPPQTNFRHMLYAESGNNMFVNLRKMIQLQYMQRAELDLWFAYSIINIAGFRGHIDQHGSIYLSEHVAAAMLHLKSLLDNMLESTQYDVLSEYLEYRAELLGLQELDKAQRITLAHLGSLMRLYTPQAGRRLQQSFTQLPKHLQEEYVTFFTTTIHSRSAITYVPALFANALLMSEGNIELVVATILPVYAQAFKLRSDSISFNQLAKEANVQRLLAQDKVKLSLNADHELAVTWQ